jgi:hypothetical protein
MFVPGNCRGADDAPAKSTCGKVRLRRTFCQNLAEWKSVNGKTKMKRREFLGTLIATGGVWLANAPGTKSTDLLQPSDTRGPEVKRVLVVFKCHFDAGFIDTQAAVVRRYFDEYFPKAIETAELLNRSGAQRYMWTTGSWLLYEYLEQANTEQRKKMEQAIHSGFIAWHALPFTWQTELMDPTLISGALGLSQSLDRRFGYKTTGAKMTDVPGHTRGIVAPLAANGVTFLDIGVNDASRPAILPSLFRWKDGTGASLMVMYHPGYGAVTVVPNSGLAIAIVVRDDNSGPHTPEEIAKTYADLKKRFANAEIVATNLSTVANEVAKHANALPVVMQEIGDTWIHGIASDPVKVARYREVCRLRQKWIHEGQLQAGDATDVQLLRYLLLEAEHTWGTDTKTWLDFDNYIPMDLEKMLDTKYYMVVESSWNEKRRNLFLGIATLPASLQQEATTALALLEGRRPQSLKQPLPPSYELETAHFLFGLDKNTGAIQKLHRRDTGRDWASAEHPLGLFSYQTLSQEDYARFFHDYVISDADWAKKDFGKPNIERFGARSQVWKPAMIQCEMDEDSLGHRICAQLEIQDPDAIASGRAAFPRKIFIEYVLPKSKPAIEVNVSWFGKEPTRLPEALWLSFNPIVTDAKGWTMQKTGQEISPFDVVDCGNRHMHAVSDRVSYKDGTSGLSFVTLDAPLVALGRQSPLNFSRAEASFDGGIHFNLFNNAWGTNYIMWYGEDMRFRFAIEA